MKIDLLAACLCLGRKATASCRSRLLRLRSDIFATVFVSAFGAATNHAHAQLNAALPASFLSLQVDIATKAELSVASPHLSNAGGLNGNASLQLGNANRTIDVVLSLLPDTLRVAYPKLALNNHSLAQIDFSKPLLLPRPVDFERCEQYERDADSAMASELSTMHVTGVDLTVAHLGTVLSDQPTMSFDREPLATFGNQTLLSAPTGPQRFFYAA